MPSSQSVKATAKYVRISPHKVRQVLDQIRGRSYQEALMILEFLPYDAGSPIWQVVHSVAANAKNNYNLDKKKLIISEIFANEGPKLKRIRPRAQGPPLRCASTQGQNPSRSDVDTCARGR